MTDMRGQTISSLHQKGKLVNLKVLILLAAPILISACVPVMLTPDDKAAINAGDKGLVLVRVLCTVDDKPFEPCIFRRNDPLLSDKLFVGFAMGSFETFGEPGNVKVQALSDESFDQGWAFFLLSPGIYYLYLRGPDSSQVSTSQRLDYYSRHKNVPRWRIDVPEGGKLIYAGTLTLAGQQVGKLLFGDPIIVPVKDQQVPLSDEGIAADSLLAKHFPGKEVHKILMRAWKTGDPFIFQRPLPRSVK